VIVATGFNVQKMHIAHSDKPAKFYNLDVIISVGYRVSSKRGTQFRIWTTNVLRNHILRGYSINDRRFKELNQAIRLGLEMFRQIEETKRLHTASSTEVDALMPSILDKAFKEEL
jgi:hypothetical protein